MMLRGDGPGESAPRTGPVCTKRQFQGMTTVEPRQTRPVHCGSDGAARGSGEGGRMECLAVIAVSSALIFVRLAMMQDLNPFLWGALAVAVYTGPPLFMIYRGVT